MTCSMCDNKEWTFSEVLEADAGVCNIRATVKKLCEDHKVIFKEQRQEWVKKTIPK